MRRLFIIVFTGLITGCGTLSNVDMKDMGSVTPIDYVNSHHLRTEVDALAQPLIDKKQAPGIVIGILLPDGSRQFFGYGVTEQGGHNKPNANTLFTIGSLSKGFLSATAAMLVQEGILAWEDTLAQLLPPETELSEDAKKITLLQLATHTSGLPRQPFTPRTLLYFTQYLFTGESFYRHLDRDYLIDYLSDFSAPKTVVPQYSNIGYGLLGYALELKTGKKMDALVREKILEPLQLKHTGYNAKELSNYTQRAYGYAGDQPYFIRRGQPTPDWQFTDVLIGSAALHSSAADLLSYAQAHLYTSGNPLLDHALQDTLQVRVDRNKEAAALAWIVDQQADCKITYQIGLVGGYTSYIGLNRANKTAVVVLQNSFTWNNSVGHNILLRLQKDSEKQ